MAPAPIEDTVTSTPRMAPETTVATVRLRPCSWRPGWAVIQAIMRRRSSSATTVSITEPAIA